MARIQLYALILLFALVNTQSRQRRRERSSQDSQDEQVTNQEQQGQKAARTCLPQYGLDDLMNYGGSSDFNFCWEHSGRTCCSTDDVAKIRQKVGVAKQRSTGNDDNNLSDQCLLMSARASCAPCDGDLGTGKSLGLCLDFCDTWFVSCIKDYIDPYITNPQEKLPFCGKDSLICSPVEDVIESSRKFCEFMGFQVQSPDEAAASGKTCYDGTPSNLKASSGGSSYSQYKPRTKKSKTETSSNDYLDKEYIKEHIERLIKNFTNTKTFYYLQEFAGYIGLALLGYLLYLGYKACFPKKSRRARINESINQRRLEMLNRRAAKQ